MNLGESISSIKQRYNAEMNALRSQRRSQQDARKEHPEEGGLDPSLLLQEQSHIVLPVLPLDLLDAPALRGPNTPTTSTGDATSALELNGGPDADTTTALTEHTRTRPRLLIQPSTSRRTSFVIGDDDQLRSWVGPDDSVGIGSALDAPSWPSAHSATKASTASRPSGFTAIQSPVIAALPHFMFRQGGNFYFLSSPGTTTYPKLVCALRGSNPSPTSPTLQLTVSAITASSYKSFIRRNQGHVDQLLTMYVGSEEAWSEFLSIVDDMVAEERERGGTVKAVGVMLKGWAE